MLGYKEINIQHYGNLDFMSERKSTLVRAEKKMQRNNKCSCGSGKKYKYCCGKEK